MQETLRVSNYSSLFLKIWIKVLGKKISVEEQLLAGQFQGRSKLPSIALFTLHKAGSTFLSERLGTILKNQNFAVADFGHYAVRQGRTLQNPLSEESSCRRIFSAKGVFHKAIRVPVNPDWLGSAKIFLVTRDPRDIVTSIYFSLKYSHVIYSSAGMEERRRLEKTPIDQFVLESGYFEAAVKTLETYQAYFRFTDRFLHLKYEELVTQPETSSARVQTFLGLPEKKERIFSSEDFAVNGENVLSHRRQILPGDHARKLSPETIRICNKRIRHLASFYGWDDIN